MLLYICDDDIFSIKDSMAKLRELRPDTEVEYFLGGEELLERLSKAPRFPDAILLDIEMGKTNGIDIATRISAGHPGARLLFVTAFGSEYFEEIFLSVKPYAIIKKPVKPENLDYHLGNLERDIAIENQVLLIRFKGVAYRVPFKSIIFLESDRRTVRINTKREVFTAYEKLDEISKRLGDGFIRCQKSYCVNIDYIKQFDISQVTLAGGEIINISSPYRADARTKYFDNRGKINLNA